ncbi:SNF2 family N-terminal domain-containing protein [Aspergillus pseudoustus]|uniref:SNF2 family N-terminal domain-containing protein n=1 Tax=Aspergillus pseudoustus TaxID=1810923 RepID=A0ABR4JZB8_9EURO
MSLNLKRLLNPTGSGEDDDDDHRYHQNLWQDDYARVRPRIEGPENWSFTTPADSSSFGAYSSYSYTDPTEAIPTIPTAGYNEPTAFGNVFDTQSMLYADPYASGPSSQEIDSGMDAMMLDSNSNSFLAPPPSDSAALSASVTSSFTSTPIEFVDEQQYGSADVSMVDGEVGDAGQAQEQAAEDVGEIICYGMLLRERVRLIGKGTELQEKILKLRDSGTWNPAFPIHQSSGGELFLRFPDNDDDTARDKKTNLGHLSEKMVKALQKLMSIRGFEIEAHADLNAIISALRASKAAEAAFRVHVNVYGGEGVRDLVGKELSKKGLFLQEPDVRRVGTRYDNPHLLRLEGMEELESEGEEEEIEDTGEGLEGEGEGDKEGTPPERDTDFDETIADVYRSLRRADGLTRLEGDENLSKALYPHQAEALDFMTQRETGNIADEYRLWKRETVGGEQLYRHAITGTKEREEPDESGGGILADEMGMGKSLTTLVLIGKTMPGAKEWVSHQTHLQGIILAEKPCRATLVVVPSRVLINTWVREIDNHLNASLKVLIYHGRSRKEAIQKVEDYDIVITTYNTLAKEHAPKLMGGPKSPLHEYAWYRVVLDEGKPFGSPQCIIAILIEYLAAHMIRRRETTFHRAVIELPAKIRWCLSGTPIQNTLDDLGSLLAFIHIRPFHDPRTFRHQIVSPFGVKKSKRDAIKRLTTLLEAICLRRTITKVHLPEPLEEFRTVKLTPREREQYRLTHGDMHRLLHQQAGEYKEKASTFGTFQIWLQLRSFCNHGTFQPRFSWAKRHLVADEMDSVRSLARDSWDRCLTCREPLPITARERRSRYVENCKHVLCESCAGDGDAQGPEAVDDLHRAGGRLHCPVCESLGRTSDDEETRGNYLLKEGYSSKMQALVTDVQRNLENTKSIIFSCWTRTLDLIAQHLNQADIEFERIDGKTLSTQRQKILDKFNEAEAVPVLIMTTGTGAFGLNLQSVNRVFIVEPQWNPSVESQAIARAIRLGQDQRVRVIRYRVEDSIEQEMCSQQMQKLEISKMDFAKDITAQEPQNVVSEGEAMQTSQG